MILLEAYFILVQPILSLGRPCYLCGGYFIFVETVGSIPETVGSIVETVGSFVETFGSFVETVGSLVETVGSIPGCYYGAYVWAPRPKIYNEYMLV